MEEKKKLFEEKFKIKREKIINNFIRKNKLTEEKFSKEQKKELKEEIRMAYLSDFKKIILTPIDKVKST